ncbi:5-oxoprolinase subunit C family protein [Aegicerativicinus sediminis]|uniref:5-oxoprolinase subunit C family protein n=1 Tax=Aegicerativicinus sediminis TaxID=2893202 RepID=UPI001E456315|nr:biotin-dependent carboxyltransferase family protein [Aegicerativicinus sediminis]
MIEVLSSGFYSTIQDLGRFGFSHYGVPVSGAMDETALRLANALLNNSENAAGLEITMTGPKLRFQCPTAICVTGAEMQPQINGQRIENCKIYAVDKGSILGFGRLTSGFRTYLAVKGGISTEPILGSRSQLQSVTGNSVIKRGHAIPIQEYSGFTYGSGARIQNKQFIGSQELMECFKGPEFEMLPEHLRNQLVGNTFTVSNHFSRMGYQIQEELSNSLPSMITSAVLPGTVQLTPQGKLIILMRDSQTTGGYPRVLQLTEKSIDGIAQKKMGDKLVFKLIEF